MNYIFYYFKFYPQYCGFVSHLIYAMRIKISNNFFSYATATIKHSAGCLNNCSAFFSRLDNELNNALASGRGFDFYKSTAATQTVRAMGKTFHFPTGKAAAFIRRAFGDKSKSRSPSRSNAAMRSARHRKESKVFLRANTVSATCSPD